MRKITLFLILLFQVAFASEKDSVQTYKKYNFSKFFKLLEDCDACGCSASGGSMGFASMLNTNFIGIRYFNQAYKSTDGLYSNSVWYRENFNTIQVWARIPVVKKIQISALVPYNFHNREIALGTQSISGLGDITVLGMYEVYKTRKDSIAFVQTLQLGAGIKIPVGSYDEKNNGSFNPSYQVGTGSWDYLFATEYIVKHKKIGLNAMLNYILKTENDKKYRFGNQFNYATTLFYLYETEKISFATQVGVAGEVYQDNYQLGQKVRNTSGDILFGKMGFEVGITKYSIGASIMLPINQNLNGGNVEAQYRWSLNFNYSL